MEGGPPNFPPGSSCRAVLRHTTRSRPSRSATGLSPSRAPRSKGVRVASRDPSVGPLTPEPLGPRFGLRPFRSPLLRASRLISLPPGTEMFQFPGFASGSRKREPDDDVLDDAAGFPHSAIRGSTRVCRSPRRIAAYRALPRLRVPRHPPLAVPRLTTSFWWRKRLSYGVSAQSPNAARPSRSSCMLRQSRATRVAATDRAGMLGSIPFPFTATSFVKQLTPHRSIAPARCTPSNRW